MAATAPNEMEEVIKELKSTPGYLAYILMNNDGIIIKHENIEYQETLMNAYHVLSLFGRTKKHMQRLIPDPSDSEVEWLRLRTKLHEMIIAQHHRFTIVVLQQAQLEIAVPDAAPVTKAEDGKDKEAGGASGGGGDSKEAAPPPAS